MKKTSTGLLVALVVAGLFAIATLAARMSVRPMMQESQSAASSTAETVSQTAVNSGEYPVSGDHVHNLPVEPAAARARTALATRLHISESAIVILSVQAKQWPNACLGLAQSGEMCAEVITPGFEVELTAGGKTYSYHTNQTGSVLRAAS